MSNSTHDILMILLQFLYAFGGLILFGSLIFNIMKNQALVNEKRLRFEKDFDEELGSQLTEQRSQGAFKVSHTGAKRSNAFHRKTCMANSETPGKLPGSGAANGREIPLKSRPAPLRENVVEKAKASRYTVAAMLAARGFEAKDIRRQVGLPQCEIDLITGLNDTYEKGRWEAHQSMLDAIDSEI